MRLVFSILALVVVLAAVGSLARRQVAAPGLTAQPAAGTPAPEPTAPRQVADEVNKLVQQGASRIEKAEP